MALSAPQIERPVLVVEDDHDIRETCKQILELEGYTVLTAANGQQALEMLRKYPRPSVILLDMMMPIMDGPSTLEALRSNDRTRNIPVIFLTAKAMTSEIEKLKRMGARGVLTKPFDPTVLANQMRAILEA